MKWSEVLPWLVPLLISMLLGYAKLYEVVNLVEKVALRQDTEGRMAIKEVNNLRWRVHNIEKYCCKENKPWSENVGLNDRLVTLEMEQAPELNEEPVR